MDRKVGAKGHHRDFGETLHVSGERRVGAQIGASGKAVRRVLVPVQLHAQAAHQAIASEDVELRADIGAQKIGVADDRMRPAGFIRRALDPGDLVLESLWRPVGLHVDRSTDTATVEIGEELVDQVVAANGLIGSEDARLHRARQPRQVRLPPDVMMCVDEAAHGIVRSLACVRVPGELQSQHLGALVAGLKRERLILIAREYTSAMLQPRASMAQAEEGAGGGEIAAQRYQQPGASPAAAPAKSQAPTSSATCDNGTRISIASKGTRTVLPSSERSTRPSSSKRATSECTLE